METSAKCISLGPADYRKRVSNAVWVSPAQVYGGFVHRGCPPAGSGNGTGNKSSVRERGHIICTSLQQGNRIQPVFHSFKEGWRVASHFRSSSSERIRHAAQVQNVNFETNRVTNQIRGLVCHDRTQGRILSYIHSSMSQEVPEVRFWGKAYQYRVLPFGLELSPRTFTKCVDAALVLPRLQGIRIMNYIDDWLILAQSHQLAVRHRDVVLAYIKKMGLRLNAKEGVLSPLQRTTFLGVIWDSTSMQTCL